jgi:hypothetical protein
MPPTFCAPFADCASLDGRLLINSALQGPPLAFDLGEVSFGSFTSSGAAARPYVDLRVEQTWNPREACYGPVRSIFSLAPGETVQLAVSLEEQTSLVHTVADHLQDTRDVPVAPSRGVGPGASAGAPGGVGGALGVAGPIGPLLGGINRATRYVGAYGSLFESLADPAGLHNLFGGGGQSPPASGGSFADAIGQLVGNATSGGGRGGGFASSGIANALEAAAKAAEAAGRAQTSHTRDDTTTTTSRTDTRQTLTRTFSNPYRDRSLQLRFIPVFRRFDVTSLAVQPGIGLALHVGPLQGATLRSLSEAVASPTDASVQRPLARLINQQHGPTAHAALAWSQSEVREDSVLVPLTDPQTASRALGLTRANREQFIGAIDGITSAVAAIRAITKSVHLFMGTHVEAVAGDCVLEGLPPLEEPPPDA